jgi:hypothetical protein
LTWWEALIPAVLGAVSIRAVALLSPTYFSWVELFSDLSPEGAESQKIRRQTMLARLFVPFVVVALTRFLWQQDMSYWSAGSIGLLIGFLMLWPIVFQGLPFGILKRDWLLWPIYGSFLCLLMMAAMFGWGISEIFLAVDDPIELILTSGGELITSTVVVAILLWIFQSSASKLGKQRGARSGGTPENQADDPEE